MRDRRLATTLPLLPARCQEGMELPTMQRSMFQVLDALGCSPEEGAFVPPCVASGPDPRGEGEEWEELRDCVDVYVLFMLLLLISHQVVSPSL